MSSGRYYWNLTRGSVVKSLFWYFDTSKKKLTLARISPRNIYLKLFSGAHFYWSRLKACNIAKRTCLSYVWTAVFLWSYCHLKFRYCACFEQEVLKLQSVDSLGNARSSHRRCSVRKWGLQLYLKKETLAQVFFSEFCEISKNTFFTEHLLTTASDTYVT